MKVVKEYPSATIYWQDDAQTVIVMDVRGGWGWRESYDVFAALNAAIRGQAHGVYTIIFFQPGARALPEGLRLHDLYNLMIQENPNDRLVIFVDGSPLLRRLLTTVSRVYYLSGIFARYRFASDMEQALALVESDRQG